MKRYNKAISEVIGTTLLLAIAVTAFSAIYIFVLSDPGPAPDIHVTVVGRLGMGGIIFEHRGGESLSLDSVLLLTIAGDKKDPIIIGDLLDEEFKIDDFWNIGEILVYLDPDITDYNLKVEAMVTDKKSNSAVLWGTLQDGFVLSSHGYGGIWHFNESSWYGINDEVKDSSGNYNHGTAHNGAITSNQKNIKENTNEYDSIAGGNGGFFNGYSSYIEIDDHPSLDIRNNISIQAWLKTLVMDPIVGSADLGEAFAYKPDIVHVNDTVYAVAARGQVAHEGILVTFEIYQNGSLSSEGIYNNTYNFDPKWGRDPDIIPVEGSENVFVIAYRGVNNRGILKTLTILSNGTILQEYINMTEFDSSDGWDPKIIHISGDKYVIAYTGGNKSANITTIPGILKTFTIDINGVISSISSPVYFNDTIGIEPDIIHFSDNQYAISYRNGNNKNNAPGKLKTVIINDGAIGNFLSEIEFDNKNGWESNIIKVTDNILGVAYRGKEEGYIKTYEILSNGEINSTSLSEFEITSSNKCYNIRIVHADVNTFGLTYATGLTGNPTGELISVKIDNTTGIITDEKLIAENIGDSKFFEPDIIHIHGGIFTIAYRTGAQGGPPHHGKLTSIFLGDDTTPPYLRGIVKGGAAQIYANLTHVYGSLNGPDYNLTIPITPNQWYHVVLTYDGKTISLYCYDLEANISISVSRPYSGLIKENENTLLFGHKFSGLIDEIYIFDYALTPEQINHYNNSYNYP